jgi:hypothetical protein
MARLDYLHRIVGRFVSLLCVFRFVWFRGCAHIFHIFVCVARYCANRFAPFKHYFYVLIVLSGLNTFVSLIALPDLNFKRQEVGVINPYS